MACCSPKCKLISLFTCGGVLTIIGITLLILWPTIFLSIMKNQLVLKESSLSYQMWVDTPIPMYLKFHFYNLTNAEEMIADPDNVKPHFNETGPYVFSEYHLKVNQTWYDNGTITFYQRRTWQFEREMSAGDLSDTNTNVNSVIVTAGRYLRNFPACIKLIIDEYLRLRKQQVIVTKTIKELVFDGYEDDLVTLVNKYSNITNIKLPFEKFGWLVDRNGSDTYDGLLGMFTGATDINKLGVMDTWNRKNQLNTYEGECGRVQGSTGELFPPQYEFNYVSVFAPDVCSTIVLNRKGDTELLGVPGTLFVGDNTVFDNGWKFDKQKCYCREGKYCAPPGARDVSRCKWGAPAYVSYPHFYLADDYYLSKVDGIKPNPEDDEFRFSMQTFAGVPLSARAQFQINLLAERSEGFEIMNQLPHMTFFPMLWFAQEVALTEEYASLARLALKIPRIVEGILYAFLVIAAVLFSCAAFMIAKRMRRTSDTEQLMAEETNET